MIYGTLSGTQDRYFWHDSAVALHFCAANGDLEAGGRCLARSAVRRRTGRHHGGMAEHSKLSPRLVVRGASQAIDYYRRTLGAKEIARYDDDAGKVAHSELSIGDNVFMVKDEDEVDRSPGVVGGSPVILTLQVDDADAVAARMVEAGGAIVFPIEDQEYGSRAGRVVDPYGHLWILNQFL
ncbi:MAG: VOC family protein [Micromonosporaceae bacterium]